VARRIVDRRVLHLIKMRLECPIEETDGRGGKTGAEQALLHPRALMGKLKPRTSRGLSP
jgi:hypothetical protein